MACGEGVHMGSMRKQEERKKKKILDKLPRYVEPWKDVNVRYGHRYER
jgi:hypothetical protein